MGPSRGLAVIALALALTLAAAGPSVAAEQSASGPDPVVKRWPYWPYQTTCGGGPFSPVEVFSGPTGSELGSRPSETALREFLATNGWVQQLVPSSDWRLLAESTDRAQFASGRLVSPPSLGTMTFRQQDGKWSWAGLSSDCNPASIVQGLEAVTWRLATEKQLPGKNSRRIWVDLGPGPCASGIGQNARARKPVFRQLGKKLLVTIVLDPLPPGVYTCIGITEPPLMIRLPGRLGSRKLFDAGTYPPGNVARQWRRAKKRSPGNRTAPGPR